MNLQNIIFSADIEMLGTYQEHDETIENNKIHEKLKGILRNCNCMPSCTSITYETEVTQNPLNSSKLYAHFDQELAAVFAELVDFYVRKPGLWSC